MKKKVYVITILAEHDSFTTNAYSMLKTDIEDVKEYLREERDDYIENYGIRQTSIEILNKWIDNNLETQSSLELNGPEYYIEFTINTYEI